MARRITLRSWRKFSQAAFLLLFLLLFRLTEYSGSDEIPYAVNIFFRWDPLVAATFLFSTGTFVAILLPSLIILVLTLVFGRIFCGWLCPMGTILDLSGKLIKPREKSNVDLRSVKYILLTLILLSSFPGLQLVGFFDPFSILVRALTLGLDPVLHLSVTSIFDAIYVHGPSWLSEMSEPLWSLMQGRVLPHSQSSFQLATVSTAILFAVIALEKLSRRFWCRNLCPLGAMLSLFSLFSPYRRNPMRSCKGCQHCAPSCRMNAFAGEKRNLRQQECILCMDCVDDCLNQPARFNFATPGRSSSLDISRRSFIGAGLAGFGLGLLAKVDQGAAVVEPTLLRPPGAVGGQEFLSRCVRCGECMKVCVQNALQPCFLETGYDGMFSPKLVPRLAYCEFNCTLCGQVCPTGAIQKLTREEKQKFVIGVASFDQARCLPFAKQSPCIVCEEHCPTHDKAIKFREVTVTNEAGESIQLQQPYVVPELCIGCGICETKCPLPGPSAIRVFNTGEESGDDYATVAPWN